ncbi:MAG: hypothetical protein QF362_00440 [Candidatus Woesearchaeota archaeon]|jgi:hypothetical protein|nr:hypothetical protein [Candidatus Woesearchaeota archaeon]MDP7505898.1 hypothetical protein [Candidatus Woesearchaeota archaeon]MDP7610281.1 hypothetical protein [Candidatus Woesearchaeota archaeon]|tara:strand:- start:663 stop:1265 length:603 start_codon:yes stop_codon:yes gene_type:complete
MKKKKETKPETSKKSKQLFPNFKRLRKIDLLAVIILVLLWSTLTYFISLSDTTLTFMLSLALTIAFMAFIALLINRPGAILIFSFLGALATSDISNFGGLGWNKVIILTAAGLVFELISLLFTIEFKNIPLSVILGAGLSAASIPFTMFLLASGKKEIMPYVLNFSLTALVLGTMTSVIIFLIWYNIKNIKPIIRFEYHI